MWRAILINLAPFHVRLKMWHFLKAPWSMTPIVVYFVVVDSHAYLG